MRISHHRLSMMIQRSEERKGGGKNGILKNNVLDYNTVTCEYKVVF